MEPTDRRPFEPPPGQARSDRAEALGFLAKLLVGPPVFIGSSVLVLWGALAISFQRPGVKLLGLAAILAGIFLASFGWWFILGRPRQWFAPGFNDPANAPPHRRSTVRDWLRRRN